ncbi:MAG: beta-galactosidase, partial [Verrucomicrobia bacterium]|nr:beta-galactosidase [Verrucomicrobiota bacterium]
LAELTLRREQEARELAESPGPTDWDKYGGWAAGPQLKATGFFRTERVGDKWWLVDPAGHQFFSHGIDCVRMLDTTPVDERENWFEAFPGQEPKFAEFLSRGYALKGHYEGGRPQCFSFADANLLRKYGADWRRSSAETIHKRLRSWGLNTIGNWSDESVRLMRLTAYTDSIGSGRAGMIQGSEGYWGRFPDVFDPQFEAAVHGEMESRKGRSAGDPWCIGYFCDNEMSWGDELSLAIAALKSPRGQTAKQVFVADLRAKYGSITNLNEAWGANHTSWDALLESRQAPDREKAGADLKTFYTQVAERYFKTVRDAIKSVAPNQLFLGCRFAWVNPRAAAAAAKYCDVVSYNLYQRSVADFQFNGGADVPLLIGEFHFGALDRGLFHTGLVPVADQAARAQAYKDYVESVRRHPQMVGCHWFQYQDEPTIGRVFDEENYQIGFVDIADTPYAETIEAARAVGYNLYH